MVASLYRRGLSEAAVIMKESVVASEGTIDLDVLRYSVVTTIRSMN